MLSKVPYSQSLRPYTQRRFSHAFPKLANVSSCLRPSRWPTAKFRFPAVTLVAVGIMGLAFSPFVQLDSGNISPNTREDPQTSIAFPVTLQILSKPQLPTCTLIGLGTRTVSFLGIRVYSIAFYADLSNPDLQIPANLSPEEQILYLVDNTTCILRLIPTRSTSYSHLRDGFFRALQGRVSIGKKNGSITPDMESPIHGAMIRLKSIFPNMPLTKHSSMDVILTAPQPGSQRKLIVWDLGKVESTWLGTEFFKAYFEGQGISPSMKQDAIRGIEQMSIARKSEK